MNLKRNLSSLTRKIQPIQQFIKDALEKNKVSEKYLEHPHYQQNDYIGWITKVKQEKTRSKRLNQMLKKLRNSNKYMKYNAKRNSPLTTNF